ncbi:hypothetical protein SAMN03080615_01638 [Amphritea atlantica]|uniref:Uncharacterized protein n=1 Tax=Amphritea atlantica TaxID=355243 RepID=A0A1H9GEP7_9GAMM|nr:hypothetical protein [Amphritea atlantica]SEQ48544.1 hypothetical protein SAMN03080615_01638 [Amphritea atlantica]
MQRDFAVIQLPGELCRMREADRLIERWCRIQTMVDRAEKVAALFEWRLSVHDHALKMRRSVK